MERRLELSEVSQLKVETDTDPLWSLRGLSMTLSPLSALIHHSPNMEPPKAFHAFITTVLYPGLFVPLCPFLS